MKRTMILTLAVLLGALAVCALAQAALNRTVAEADGLRRGAIQAAEGGDAARAGALVSELAGLWHEREPLMQMLASHDALHDVCAAIAEAGICLRCGDHDDFLRTMSNVELGLSHLRDEQAIRWSNLY